MRGNEPSRAIQRRWFGGGCAGVGYCEQRLEGAMWGTIVERVQCWLGMHLWESRGGSFGLGSVLVCRRCGKHDD